MAHEDCLLTCSSENLGGVARNALVYTDDEKGMRSLPSEMDCASYY